MDAAFRTVARLVRQGHLGADGSVAPGADLGVGQMRDYVRVLFAWNPDVVEESDFEGRKKGELAEFLARYAAAPELVNRVRGAEDLPSMERVLAHLHGSAAEGRIGRKKKPELVVVPVTVPGPTKEAVREAAMSLAREAEEAKRRAEEAVARAAREEQLRTARREALDQHHELRVKRDALRQHIQAALLLDIRRRRLNESLERIEGRIAELTADILGSDGGDQAGEEAGGRLDLCQADLESMQREHLAVCQEAAAFPIAATGENLDAVLTRLLVEVRDLEEEQALMTEKVSKADVAILVGGF